MTQCGATFRVRESRRAGHCRKRPARPTAGDAAGGGVPLGIPRGHSKPHKRAMSEIRYAHLATLVSLNRPGEDPQDHDHR